MCQILDDVQMCPWWCCSYSDAWQQMVDKWFTPEWTEAYNAARQRRALMTGVPHHQGSRSLASYAEAWVLESTSLF
jgi:hypothetical protein